jgi:hypothetical protein
MRLLLSLFFAVGCSLPGCLAAPQVKLGNTTVTGRDIQTLQQEFFAGEWPNTLP